MLYTYIYPSIHLLCVCNKCAPGGRVWVGHVLETGSRHVLTERVVPEHNRAAQAQKNLDIRRPVHRHVVGPQVRQWIQVVEKSVVCHGTVRRLVWRTRCSGVPHIIKIAVIILWTKKTESYELCDEKIHIWHKQLRHMSIQKDLTLSLLMSCTVYMELPVKPETLTHCRPTGIFSSIFITNH
jgi:hypothetical protein